MYKKFNLTNLDNRVNKRIRIESVDDSALEVYKEELGFYSQVPSLDLCISPFVKEDVEISCEGAVNDTGFLELTGDWTLEVNGIQVRESVPVLDALIYLQNTGDFDIVIGDEINFSGEFDYVVASYTWVEANGTDLDTRTSVINPPRNIEVGWDRAFSDDSFLIWGGDNTSSYGPEAVLIDINALKRVSLGVSNIQILLKAFWFSSVYNGDFNLKFTTYKGGTMSPDSNYSFYNSGGRVVDEFTIQAHTYSQDKAGTPLGYLNIDLDTGVSSFVIINEEP